MQLGIPSAFNIVQLLHGTQLSCGGNAIYGCTLNATWFTFRIQYSATWYKKGLKMIGTKRRPVLGYNIGKA
jgi:hypothetical protein